MLHAKELFDAGRLSEAIAHLTQEVRAHPTDTHRRIFLVELLCFAGDFQRAARQLDAVGHQDASLVVGVQVFRNVLAAEEARHRLFSEGLHPRFLFEPPPYAALHLEAINRLREGQSAAAKVLLEESERARPPMRGQLDGKPSGDFRDADDLLAPFLEVIVGAHYVWLPFAQMQHLHIPPPKQLRDLLWTSATITSHHGPVEAVLLPVLYPESSTHTDERVRLGRMTDWQSVGAGLVRGVGQRLFLAGSEGKAILEVRDLAFEVEAHGAQA